MPPKKIRLPYKKERCLLSDVLPFEIPISFSNRHFYEFVLRHRVQKIGETIVWLKSTPTLDRIVCLLLCLPENPDRLSDIKKFVGEQELDFRQYKLDNKGISPPKQEPNSERFMTPFSYKISHKQNEFRELCVPHPKSQLSVVDFYERCKETILYYTSLSPFSIRAPFKVSKYTYHKDSLHFERLSEDATQIEVVGKEYESLKSFFVYKDYSNIYKFYESYRYHRSEKKYNKLVKLDVSKCFDSIYTHSIGWAVIGKGAQKESLSKNSGTFPDQFDKLMHHMNLGETNGIIIGPEFSRIFAEIILQSIDREVEHKLRNCSKPLQNQADYEIYRYVDDYFIFYNDEDDKIVIVDELQHALKNYKLYLNTAKETVYEKPIITEITMAKQQIGRLLEDKIKFTIEKTQSEEDGEEIEKGSIYINSNALITSFKTIIKTCKVEYKDMLNYTLSIVERKCENILSSYLKIAPEHRSQLQSVKALSAILEFVFFIYSVSPRVNTTIRLCRILRVIISFLKSGHVMPEQAQLIHKQIYDNVCFILRKNRTTEHTQVETLYLLIALSELGRDYWLEENILGEYLGVTNSNGSVLPKASRSLNYFSITVSLFYMRNKVRYSGLRAHIIDIAVDRIKKHSETCHKDSELVLLLFDLISCPYISAKKKCEALEIFGVTDATMANHIIEFRSIEGRSQLWFTNWLDFDFGKELDAKRSQEVY